MHDYVFFNRQIVSAQDAAVSAVSSAALYGRGIFTTIAIYDRRPFLWEKHWHRLKDNAKKLEIDLAEFSAGDVKNALSEITEENDFTKGRARITFFDESSGGIWSFESSRKTSLLITTASFREVSDNFRITVSPYRINSASLLAGVKSCNYLEKILALEEVKGRGFDEAIWLNERGEIVSACMANIFWLNDNKLFTPSLKTGCLAGTTREFLLEKVECSEVECGLEDLQNADAFFLTSAGIGIVQVAELEGRKYDRKDYAILGLIGTLR